MVKGSDKGKTAPGKQKPRKDRDQPDRDELPAAKTAKDAALDLPDRAAPRPDTQIDSQAERRAERQAERAAAKVERQAARQAERDARRAARQAGKDAKSRPDSSGPQRGNDSGATVADPILPEKAGKPAGKDARVSAQDDAPARPKPSARQPAPPVAPPVPPVAAPTGDATNQSPPIAAARAPFTAAPAAKRTAAPAIPSEHAPQSGRPASQRPPSPHSAPTRDFDILIVAQGGGIDRDAAILAASLRRNAPGFTGRLIVAEPQPTDAWSGTDPMMSPAARAALTGLGAEIRPLAALDFGRGYPHGNKIEALGLLNPARPFLFLDSDTLILGDISAVPFDFARPSASMRRTGTWPQPPAYRETYDSIWRSLYNRFGLDMDATLDLSQPVEHWERFLYFNAGWFFGADPAEFYRRFRDWAVAVRDDPGEALACQSLDPWLDQVILPLVIHSFGGGRPGTELDGMDGKVTCHWRNLPLLYARESDRAVDEMEAIVALPEIAPLIDGWAAGQRLIRDGLGRRRIRQMFASETPPPPEQALRHRLRQADLWMA